MPYDSRVVANCFLKFANEDGVPVFPMKMQKLVYLAQGWSLALRGEPLIKDRVEAWKYGPVVPNLYHAFKQYDRGIKAPAQVSHYTFPIFRVGVQPPDPEPKIDDDSRALIETVWNRYSHLSDTQLSTLTHEPGYAWDLTMKNNANPFVTPTIPNTLIADEFQRRRNQQNVRA